MKKSLIALILLFTFANLFSQKIKLESGSLDFLKHESCINIEFMYKDMKVGNKKEASYVREKIESDNKKERGKGEKWHRAWIQDRTERFEPKFVELFNKHITKKNGPVIDGVGSEYVMLVNTNLTEPGFNIGLARRDAKVSLTCIFLVDATNEKLAVISIKDSPSREVLGTDFDRGYRIQEAYGVAGRQLAKFIIKQLKLNK